MIIRHLCLKYALKGTINLYQSLSIYRHRLPPSDLDYLQKCKKHSEKEKNINSIVFYINIKRQPHVMPLASPIIMLMVHARGRW